MALRLPTREVEVVVVVVVIIRLVSLMALEATAATSPPTWATTSSHPSLGTASSTLLHHHLEGKEGHFFLHFAWFLPTLFLLVIMSPSPLTAMMAARRLPATTSRRVLDKVGVVMAAVAARLVAMGTAEVTNNHPNTEEVTTTSHPAITPPLLRAMDNRARTVRVVVSMRFLLT